VLCCRAPKEILHGFAGLSGPRGERESQGYKFTLTKVLYYKIYIWLDCTAYAHVLIILLCASLSQVGAGQGEMAMLERDSETVCTPKQDGRRSFRYCSSCSSSAILACACMHAYNFYANGRDLCYVGHCTAGLFPHVQTHAHKLQIPFD